MSGQRAAELVAQLERLYLHREKVQAAVAQLEGALLDAACPYRVGQWTVVGGPAFRGAACLITQRTLLKRKDGTYTWKVQARLKRKYINIAGRRSVQWCEDEEV